MHATRTFRFSMSGSIVKQTPTIAPPATHRIGNAQSTDQSAAIVDSTRVSANSSGPKSAIFRPARESSANAEPSPGSNGSSKIDPTGAVFATFDHSSPETDAANCDL